MKRYFTIDIETNQLKERLVTRRSVIDTSKYEIVEKQRRFTVSEDKDGQSWLIDFGYREDSRFTIICNNAGELLIALGIVRAAFPRTKSCKS